MKTGLVVGTYRVLLPEQARELGFLHANREFYLSWLNPIRHDLVEMGRACIDPGYRNGVGLAAQPAGNRVTGGGVDANVALSRISGQGLQPCGPDHKKYGSGAERFGESLKQSFVVENRPGASNTIAADLTAKAPADGHTLLLATNTGQAIAPHLIKLGFDPLKDLQPVGLVVIVPNVLLVNTTVPVKTVAELVKAMKAKPESFRYASSGVGSTQHLAGEAFDLLAGTKSIHIPYKGSSQAHLDLIGGQVEMMFDTTSSSMPHIKSGKLKPLAVMSGKRSEQLPDVPTLTEAGFPGFEMTTWYGLFATAGTPRPVVDQLHAELKRALATPEVKARLTGLGGELGSLGVDDFGAFNRAEFERFGQLIKDAGVKTEK